MHYDKNKTKHRTLTGELLNRQHILDKNDTVRIPCEDGDCLQGESTSRTTYLERKHVN